DGKNVAQLRPDAEHARSERADPIAGAAVAGHLLIGIADETDGELLAQELRGGHVEMEIDTALVVGVRVFEVVGEAADGRELVPACRIEVGVAAAPVDRAMADPDIGK